METEIYFLLHSLGIGAKYRGFRYLAYGIALCMEDEDYLLRVSKTLYPKIAQTFQVSSSCVERDIRTAISLPRSVNLLSPTPQGTSSTPAIWRLEHRHVNWRSY